MTDPETTGHPAKFPQHILDEIHADLIAHKMMPGEVTVIDPMAGVGTGVKYLRDKGYDAVGIELEPEWARQCDGVVVADACAPWPFPEPFDVMVTSPAYGNRMADRYAGDAKGSTRHTYRIALGRPLTTSSGAALQWGRDYKALHMEFLHRASLSVTRMAIINMEDHIRAGNRMRVVDWWANQTAKAFHGWHVSVRDIESPGIRHGANSDLRVDNESLILAVHP